MTVFIIITALLGLAALGLGVIWLRKRQEANREAFEALAARRGWSLKLTEQSLGRPALLRLASRGGPEWSVQSTGTQSQSSPAPKTRMTDFVGDEPRWSDGYVFFGPVPPQDPENPLSDAAAEAWVRTHIIADGMGADLNGLERIQSPDNICVFATHNPSLRADLSDLSKLWKAWDPATKSGTAPIAMLGPEGLRVRLWSGANTADHMEAFVDFALDVGRIIGDR